jgi:hypothetical protein
VKPPENARLKWMTGKEDVEKQNRRSHSDLDTSAFFRHLAFGIRHSIDPVGFMPTFFQ